ncbi:hypothetical protein NQ318_022430 [Aromia moschata]|uniref:DUF753 domain-containing protein n=1 Tax=Aromia moschata TaxID=1265417 RepID=A0AAV8Z7M6_9CUCU|nr:hypothetical protein NQ318_022430 [Aromia moschata]
MNSCVVLVFLISLISVIHQNIQEQRIRNIFPVLLRSFVGTAVKCYVCSSTDTTNCAKISGDVLSIDCPDETPVCLTLIALGITARSCSTENYCSMYENTSEVTCKTCNSDLCNTYSSANIPKFTTSLGIFVGLYFSFKLFF